VSYIRLRDGSKSKGVIYLIEKSQQFMMSAIIGQKAPNFEVSDWVQGAPTNIDQEKDHIVLVEVFQVNCPGCFMHSLPEAVEIYNKYKDDGVRVIGIATAFEDFDKNNLENLKMLAETGQVVGETQKALSMYGQLLPGDKLQYKIPFPIGMDKLTRPNGLINQEKIMQFIYQQIPDFDSKPEIYKGQIIQRVKDYMKSKEYSAETFEKFALQGTPSIILVDRKGILRDVSFGGSGNVESMIKKLINE
jgi:thiol-disulfide isomerase/thioredoxin